MTNREWLNNLSDEEYDKEVGGGRGDGTCPICGHERDMTGSRCPVCDKPWE